MSDRSLAATSKNSSGVPIAVEPAAVPAARSTSAPVCRSKNPHPDKGVNGLRRAPVQLKDTDLGIGCTEAFRHDVDGVRDPPYR